MIIKNVIDDRDFIISITRQAAEDNGNHRNSKNYLSFEKRLPNYLVFNVVFFNDKVAAFGGIYHDPSWPDNLVRVADRMFTFPEFRLKGNVFPSLKETEEYHSNNINTQSKGGFCSQVLFPHQTKLARDIGKIPFLSIQDLTRRRGVKKWLDTRIDPKLGYKLLPKLYFTCGGNIHNGKRCWQNILASENINLPSIELEAYKDLK